MKNLKLIIISVSFLGDSVKALAPCVRATYNTNDERGKEKGYHTIGGYGKAFTIISVDASKDKSPNSRETTNNKEHKSLSTSTELSRE